MKTSRTFRLSSFVDNTLKNINSKLGIKKTTMIELSVIEKSQRMGFLMQNSDDAIKCIDEMIKALETAKNRLK